MNTVTINLTKEEALLVKWVMKAASTDDSRPTLCYMNVEDDYLVATNGFVLSAVPTPVSLRPHIGKHMRPIKAPGAGLNLFEVDEDGSYPNWRAMMPDEAVAADRIVSGRELARLLPLNGMGSGYMSIRYHDNEGAPITISAPHGFSVIMPVSTGKGYKDEWQTPPGENNNE
jgi:hypothetical protein